MQKNPTFFNTFLNVRQLSFSPKGLKPGYIMLDDLQARSSIHNVRAHIYQLGEDTNEKKDLKKKFQKILSDWGKRKTQKFLNTQRQVWNSRLL